MHGCHHLVDTLSMHCQQGVEVVASL